MFVSCSSVFWRLAANSALSTHVAAPTVFPPPEVPLPYLHREIDLRVPLTLMLHQGWLPAPLNALSEVDHVSFSAYTVVLIRVN
jgi:hypothetical protein